MSTNLNIRFFGCRQLGSPNSLELLFDSIVKDNYNVEVIEVGNLATERHAFWRHYKDVPPNGLAVAYEKHQVSFFANEMRKNGAIILPFEATWGTYDADMNFCILKAQTSDTVMFTQNQWEPEKSAERVLRLCKTVYDVIHPRFGWIERCKTSGYTSYEDVDTLRIPHVYWANFFGPEYVSKLDESFLLNAPGWRHEKLADGGLLYVMSPTLQNRGRQEKTLQQSVKAYFGVNSVRAG